MFVDKTGDQIVTEFNDGKMNKGEAIRLLATLKDSKITIPEALKEEVDKLKKSLDEGTGMTIL
jgi:TusA-related sulfurtransferase